MEPRPPRVVLFPQARKKARCGVPGVADLRPANCVQHSASLPPRISIDDGLRHPFNRYDADAWTEVAKHLCGRDLLCLSGTCRWFRRFLAEDSLWRYAFFHDFNLAAANPDTARPPNRSWRYLYLAAFNGSHAYCFRQNDKHIVAWRLGGFLLDCPDLLLSAKLPLPMWPPLYHSWGVKHDIEKMGACVMTDARPGVWIADFHRVRCPGCQFKSCQGVIQVLDARHSDLFLEKAYRDGTLEYEDLGQHLHDKKASAALCAVFNVKQLASPSTACVLDTGAWASSSTKGDESGGPLAFKMTITTYAAAVADCNLCHTEGFQSCFQAMRDTANDGKIVSIRISQSLL